MSSPKPAGAPAQLFFATPRERAALARERFFEEGERPSGLVPEPVIQSWSRCLGARRAPGEHLAFDPISKIRLSTVLTHNRVLLAAARGVLAELEAAIAGSAVTAILTNSSGLVVHASRPAQVDDALLRSVARVGVSLGESCVGTGAPGVAARTGELAVVRGNEHFFQCLASLHCAAAPIRDAQGRVAAVLDLTCAGGPFRFDAAAMAQLYATSIENQLLARAAQAHLLLRFQTSPGMFHTPLEGLAAVGLDGQVQWLNAAGASLLGCTRQPEPALAAGELFGLDTEALLALAHDGRARPRPLPTGLAVWLQVQGAHAGPADDSAGEVLEASAPVASVAPTAAAEPPASFKDLGRSLIEQTLAQCQGNVSKAARQLGVSRGLLYRRLNGPERRG